MVSNHMLENMLIHSEEMKSNTPSFRNTHKAVLHHCFEKQIKPHHLLFKTRSRDVFWESYETDSHLGSVDHPQGARHHLRHVGVVGSYGTTLDTNHGLMFIKKWIISVCIRILQSSVDMHWGIDW